MSEWLDLMLEEIARKRREQDDALEELERRQATREHNDKGDGSPPETQAK